MARNFGSMITDRTSPPEVTTPVADHDAASESIRPFPPRIPIAVRRGVSSSAVSARKPSAMTRAGCRRIRIGWKEESLDPADVISLTGAFLGQDERGNATHSVAYAMRRKRLPAVERRQRRELRERETGDQHVIAGVLFPGPFAVKPFHELTLGGFRTSDFCNGMQIFL